MTCGVPQGSILGPLLWNLLYDEVLREKVEVGVELIGFADDTAILVEAKEPSELKRKAENTVRAIQEHLTRLNLELAPEKTEAVILAGRRKLREMTLMCGGEEIKTKQAIRYLGVWIGKDGSHSEHVQRTVLRANQKLAQLERLMPNINGPRQIKRRVLAQAAESVMIYAAPVWSNEITRRQKSKKLLQSLQRRAAIKIAAAYRTASYEAVLVVAGLPPIELLLAERTTRYTNKTITKSEAREIAINTWQRRWTETFAAQWTKSLIPDLVAWTNRKNGEVGFYLTQALTGHGQFNKYLHRFHKRDTPRCDFCPGAEDSPEHTLFQCPEFLQLRMEAEQELGESVNKGNMIAIMLQSERAWGVVASLITTILKHKENMDRRNRNSDRTQPRESDSE